MENVGQRGCPCNPVTRWIKVVEVGGVENVGQRGCPCNPVTRWIKVVEVGGGS